MRLSGHMEIENGWLVSSCKHIPGVENRLTGGISRWLEEEMQNNVNRLTQEQGWRRQDLAGGNTVRDSILDLNLPKRD